MGEEFGGAEGGLEGEIAAQEAEELSEPVLSGPDKGHVQLPPQYQDGGKGPVLSMGCVNATFCANAIPCNCTDKNKCGPPFGLE